MWPLQAWINEKFAPELLEHKTEIVDCMLEQVKEMVSDTLLAPATLHTHTHTHHCRALLIHTHTHTHTHTTAELY